MEWIEEETKLHYMTFEGFMYKNRTYLFIFFGFTSLNSTDLKILMLSRRYAKLDPTVKEIMYHMITKNLSKIEKFLSKVEEKKPLSIVYFWFTF